MPALASPSDRLRIVLRGNDDDCLTWRFIEMNTVCVTGRLTRDPELRTTPSGTTLCSLRVAVDRAGQREDDGSFGAGFFNVDVWGKSAENCVAYLSKGKLVGVTGELRFREWEQDDGTKRQAVDINANRVDFLTPRSEESNGQQFVPAGAPAADFPGDADDDIPF